jgi:hypothetical protein
VPGAFDVSSEREQACALDFGEAGGVCFDSLKQEDYGNVFYPGGRGLMWDLVEDKNSIKLRESVVVAGKNLAGVCYSTGALRYVQAADGRRFVEDRIVIGFTNMVRKTK